MRRHKPSGGASRLVPARQPRVAGPRDGGNGTGHRLAGPGLGPQRWIGGPSNSRGKAGRLKREVHRGRDGANLKHRARDAMETADLRHYRTSTSLDVARRRGPRVRQDPGVPRALGTFRERRSVSEYGVPGAAQRIRAMTRAYSSFRGASDSERTRNSYSAALGLWIPGSRSTTAPGNDREEFLIPATPADRDRRPSFCRAPGSGAAADTRG